MGHHQHSPSLLKWSKQRQNKILGAMQSLANAWVNFRPVGDDTINKLWAKAFDRCDKPQKRSKRCIQAALDIRNAVSLTAVAHAVLFDADESKVRDYANLPIADGVVSSFM